MYMHPIMLLLILTVCYETSHLDKTCYCAGGAFITGLFVSVIFTVAYFVSIFFLFYCEVFYSIMKINAYMAG